MSFRYRVDISEMREVHEIPDAWTKVNLISLLKEVDYDEVESISDEELREMTAMALSDLEPEEAAQLLLQIRLGDKLNKGQRQNLAEELKGDRIWEEYSDLSLHEELFNIACMLHWSFPKEFAEPDIVRIQLTVTALNAVSVPNLVHSNASFLSRLLNDGMDEHNIIYRLFDDQIASNKFPESESIIWKVEQGKYNPDQLSTSFTIYTSWNWVDELKGVEQYESTAFADGQLN